MSAETPTAAEALAFVQKFYEDRGFTLQPNQRNHLTQAWAAFVASKETDTKKSSKKKPLTASEDEETGLLFGEE